MTPIEIPDVTAMNGWAYIAIVIAGLAALCFILALVDKAGEVYSNATGNPVISLTWWTLTKTGAVLLLGAAPFFLISSTSYTTALKTASSDALAQLEQEAGVTLLNKASINHEAIIQETNSVPVSFKHQENLYEGFLIIEDRSLLLHAENTTGEERQLVVFDG